jgi:hypothetical protein
MNLLERYLHEVGRFLPRKNREDIQAELRSSVIDSLEDRFGPEPTEAETADLLKELGKPQEVAASYYPQGQYLIGPELYPLFRMVIWIVIAAVLGAQLLAWGIAVFVAGEGFSPLEMLGSLINSIPGAFGWVVIIFIALQRFDVKPDLDEEPWEPESLPQIDEQDDIKRAEIIVGLVFSTLFLVLVVFFPQWIGFVTTPGGKFYSNPVILEYLAWIKISLVAGIIFEIFLLWQRRWTMLSRIAKVGLNIFSLVVLILLVQGHTAWLAARGSGGIFETFEMIPEIGDGTWELIGMHGFRMAFGVAFIVTAIETVVTLYRLVRANLKKEFTPMVRG